MFLKKRLNFYHRLCILSALLIVLGSVFVLSSSSVYGITKSGNPAYYFEKHMVWLLLGLAGILLIRRTDNMKLEKYSFPIFIISLAILPLPKFFGDLRWIRLGPLSFQPAELVKFTFIIYLADYLKRKLSVIREKKTLIVPLGFLLLITGILQLQKDIGTFAIIFCTSMLLMFLAGVRVKNIIIIILSGIVLFTGLILMFPYRRQRIMTFLNPSADPMGKGYQTQQSIIAMSSGGILGKGLGMGERKLKFLPEAHKDYIYAVVGEEAGFVGTVFVLFLFGFLVFSSFHLSKISNDYFIKFLSAGIGGLFGFQFLLHAGVVLNMVPSKGTTLPFFSVGGSSFLINILALGVLFNIARQVLFDENSVNFVDTYMERI
ncbi:MAG TPA: putative peptidoglycan glycosyltransferase FtsW [bacterium]|nr:putative peptidoglycan glycosyltransferase FtsW [bacterium]